jgi:hypothetical protein
MSGKQARRKRLSSLREAQHEDDAAYFRARPETAWRIRETIPGEWERPQWTGERVPNSTHIVIVYDRRNGVYHGLPLTPDPGVDPYDAAVIVLMQNPPRCWL